MIPSQQAINPSAGITLIRQGERLMNEGYRVLAEAEGVTSEIVDKAFNLFYQPGRKNTLRAYKLMALPGFWDITMAGR